MKYIILLVTIFPLFGFSQSFNGPESVEYDIAHSRWLVGQNGSGEVLAYNPASSGLTLFCSGMTSGPYGIEIVGNVLYCCDGGAIKGYDLTSGVQVFNLSLGATFLNGITSDGGNFLFTTDYTAKKIYRVNVTTSTYNLMVTTAKTPNGIIYDGANNRCVFVTWGAAAPIQAMSLADSTISTLRTTTLSNCDGIMRDTQGNWYVSAWGNNSLNMFDAAFLNNPVVVMSGLTSPADLGINAAHDSIGIPNSGSNNNLVFYHIPSPSGITNSSSPINTPLFPNPANDRITITLENPVLSGSIELIDMTGKVILSKQISGNIFFLDRGSLAAGNYVVNVKENSGTIIQTQKLIFR